MADHIHMPIYIPPKYSAARIVGFIKGRSTTLITRNYLE
jgi:REP element-mobilizing transposase RayT